MLGRSAVNSNRLVKRLIKNAFPKVQKPSILLCYLLFDSSYQSACVFLQGLKVLQYNGSGECSLELRVLYRVSQC